MCCGDFAFCTQLCVHVSHVFIFFVVVQLSPLSTFVVVIIVNAVYRFLFDARYFSSLFRLLCTIFHFITFYRTYRRAALKHFQFVALDVSNVITLVIWFVIIFFSFSTYWKRAIEFIDMNTMACHICILEQDKIVLTCWYYWIAWLKFQITLGFNRRFRLNYKQNNVVIAEMCTISVIYHI